MKIVIFTRVSRESYTDSHPKSNQIVLRGTLTRASEENGLFWTLKPGTVAFGLHETAAAFQWQMCGFVGFHEEYAAAHICATAICELQADSTKPLQATVSPRLADPQQALFSKRRYQIPEISTRQSLQAPRNGLQVPKETRTISGSGQLLQSICANVFWRNSTTGRICKNNCIWGIKSKCQMAASLSCTPGNIVFNGSWKHPRSLSIQLKKSLWGCITTELGRDPLEYYAWAENLCNWRVNYIADRAKGAVSGFTLQVFLQPFLTSWLSDVNGNNRPPKQL